MTNLIHTCFVLQYVYYNHLHVSSIICSSSGGWIVLMHLVSSLSVSGRPVHRLRENCRAVLSQPVHRTVKWINSTSSCFVPCLYKCYLHIYLASPKYHTSPKSSFLFRHYEQYFIHLSHLPLACYVCRPSHYPPWSYHTAGSCCMKGVKSTRLPAELLCAVRCGRVVTGHSGIAA